VFLEDAIRTRDAFRNYITVGAVAGVVLPSRIPPRGGWPRFMERRLRLRTRLGPVLETEIGNAWPIVKIYRDWERSLRIDWSSVQRVVEVGGHVGAFAPWAAAHAPGARVVTFEPEPRNFRDLQQNVQRSNLGARVVTVNAAVAAEDGYGELDVPLQRNKASVAVAEDASTAAVRCIGLERYLAREPGQIDILKLDCEGAEWDIVPSLTLETLSRIRHLVVGCHAQDDCEVATMERLLASSGFRTRRLSTGSDDQFALLVTLWGERT